MMFVCHYVIISFHPQYLPRHAPQGGGIQGGGIGGSKLSYFLYSACLFFLSYQDLPPAPKLMLERVIIP